MNETIPHQTQNGKSGVYTSVKPGRSRHRAITHGETTRGRSFEVSAIDADELADFILLVLKNGDCFCCTLTSDGGAITITVLQDEIRHKVYSSTPDGLIAKLTTLRETLY